MRRRYKRAAPIEDDALISADTGGPGRGGDIELKVRSRINISGSESNDGFPHGIGTRALSSESGGDFSGRAGDIKLEAEELIITGGMGTDEIGILSDTFVSGDAGNIDIQVKGSINLVGKDGVAVIASRTTDVGNSGAININTRELRLTDGAQISTTTFGSGDGRDIHIQVKGSIDISGVNQTNEDFNSSIFSATLGSGTGGNLEVRANSIKVENGGEISASSTTFENVVDSENILLGNAGNINLQAKNALLMENGFIRTSADIGADGGNIDITSPGRVILSNSDITTSVKKEEGNGGKITIKKPKLLVLGRSNIIASARRGDGGDIDISVDQLIKDPRSLIDASSELGIDGNVDIDSPDINIIGSLSQLPAKFSDATHFMPKPCAQRSGADVIQFVSRNYDVLPDSPYALRAPRLIQNFTGQTVAQSIEEENDDLVEQVLEPLYDC